MNKHTGLTSLAPTRAEIVEAQDKTVKAIEGELQALRVLAKAHDLLDCRRDIKIDRLQRHCDDLKGQARCWKDKFKELQVAVYKSQASATHTPAGTMVTRIEPRKESLT